MDNNIAGMLVTPEDRESGQKNEILDGAPMTNVDSALLMVKEQYQQYPYELIWEYSQNRNPEVIASSLLNHYQNIEKYFDYWEEVNNISIENNNKETHFLINNLTGTAIRAIPSLEINLENIEVVNDDIEEDFDIYSDILNKIVYSNHSEVYEAILQGALRTVQSEEETVDLLYKLCNAAVRSYDIKIEEYIVKLLSYNTPAWENDFNSAESFFKSIFSKKNDVLKKSIEIELFRTALITVFLSEKELKRYFAKQDYTLENPSIKSKLSEGRDMTTYERDEKIANFLMSFLAEDGNVAFEPEALNDFPGNLILKNQSTLLRRTQEIIIENAPEKVKGFISVPGKGLFIPENEELAPFKLIRKKVLDEMSKVIPEEITDLNNLEIGTVISYLRPNIESEEQITELEKLNAKLKKSLIENFKRSLSVRGNEIKITDKRLTNNKYDRLIFRRCDNIPNLKKSDTLVEIYLGKYRMNFFLDNDYNLLHIATRKKFSEQFPHVDKTGELLMETWILAHLEELLCKEREEFTKKNLPSSKDKEDFEKGYIQRVGHLRRLFKENSHPSEQAIRTALENNPNTGDRWDLVKINKRREENGQCPVTYVRPTQAKCPENSNSKPVKFYPDTATKDFDMIMRGK